MNVLELGDSMVEQVKLSVLIKWREARYANNFRHLSLHVSKIAGMASALAEKHDHNEPIHDKELDFCEKRLPDLVILAAMMANTMGVNLNEAIKQRVKEITETGQ